MSRAKASERAALGPIIDRMDLDELLPRPHIRAFHCITAPVSAEAMWEAGGTVTLAETPRLARIVGWRVPQADRSGAFVSMFAAKPFSVIDEGPTHSVSVLCGKIWTTEDDYEPVADREEFLAWHKPRSSKVVFAHWAEETDDGAALYSEVRVGGTDRMSSVSLRGLWALVGPFEGLVASEALRRARRHALA